MGSTACLSIPVANPCRQFGTDQPRIRDFRTTCILASSTSRQSRTQGSYCFPRSVLPCSEGTSCGHDTRQDALAALYALGIFGSGSGLSWFGSNNLRINPCAHPNPALFGRLADIFSLSVNPFMAAEILVIFVDNLSNHRLG